MDINPSPPPNLVIAEHGPDLHAHPARRAALAPLARLPMVRYWGEGY